MGMQKRRSEHRELRKNSFRSTTKAIRRSASPAFGHSCRIDRDLAVVVSGRWSRFFCSAEVQLFARTQLPSFARRELKSCPMIEVIACRLLRGSSLSAEEPCTARQPRRNKEKRRNASFRAAYNWTAYSVCVTTAQRASTFASLFQVLNNSFFFSCCFVTVANIHAFYFSKIPRRLFFKCMTVFTHLVTDR